MHRLLRLVASSYAQPFLAIIGQYLIKVVKGYPPNLGRGLRMNLEGSYEIKAPMEKVWEFINDPKKIGNCFPDLKSLEVKDQDNFTAVARVGIGFIKGDFKFRVGVVERKPPSHARLKAAGSGSGSSVDIDLSINLTQIADDTRLQYSAVARVGGVMAGLGASLVENAAKKTIDQVFQSLTKSLQT